MGGWRWASEGPPADRRPADPATSQASLDAPPLRQRGGANYGSRCRACDHLRRSHNLNWCPRMLGAALCPAHSLHSEEVSMDPVGHIDHQGGPGLDRRGKGWAGIGSIAAIALALALPLGGQAVQEPEPDAVVRLFELLDVVGVEERAATGRFSASAVPMFDVAAGALSVRIAAVKRRTAADRALGATGATRTCRYTNAKAAQLLEHALLSVADCDEGTVAEPPFDRITHVTVTVREDGEDWKLACLWVPVSTDCWAPPLTPSTPDAVSPESPPTAPPG